MGRLQRRWALVRSGDDMGTIKTLDLPEMLEGNELALRVMAMRDHTRATLCRPRREVEDELNGKPPPARAKKVGTAAKTRRTATATAKSRRTIKALPDRWEA